jgi:hypothetical protein
MARARMACICVMWPNDGSSADQRTSRGSLRAGYARSMINCDLSGVVLAYATSLADIALSNSRIACAADSCQSDLAVCRHDAKSYFPPLSC